MISAALSVLKTERERNIVNEIYSANAKRFYAIAFSKLKSGDDAEDAVQEAFLRIAKKPEKFFAISEDKRVAYIDVIVRNVALDMLKKRARTENAELCGDVEDPAPLPEDIVLGEEMSGRLIDFILSMPEARRQAVILKVRHNMNSSEIAEALGISEAAARKRLSDAGIMIKEFLDRERNHE